MLHSSSYCLMLFMCKTFTSHNTGNVLSPQNFRSIINYNTHIFHWYCQLPRHSMLWMSYVPIGSTKNPYYTSTARIYWIQELFFSCLLAIHWIFLVRFNWVQMHVLQAIMQGIFFFRNFEDLPNSNVQAFNQNIHKNKALNLAQVHMFQKDNIGQSIWDTHVLLLGTCWGNRMRTWGTVWEREWGTKWELDGNNLGTPKIQKVQLPSPFPKGKRKETKQRP
jgi:hypothetical protein